MDYRQLLIKYINHIGNMEGISYIERFEKDMKSVGITDEEIKELKILDEEGIPWIT